MLHHRTPTHDDLIQRRARDTPMHDVDLPRLGHGEQTRVEPGDPLLARIDEDEISAPDAIALPAQALPEGGAGVGVGAGEEAFALKGDGAAVEFEVDGAGPGVEGGGADDGGGVAAAAAAGARGGLRDGHVRLGAEGGAGVLVHLVERVGFVHVGDGHVAVGEAVAVDV